MGTFSEEFIGLDHDIQLLKKLIQSTRREPVKEKREKLKE
jgi:hypothetical protein